MLTQLPIQNKKYVTLSMFEEVAVSLKAYEKNKNQSEVTSARDTTTKNHVGEDGSLKSFNNDAPKPVHAILS